MIVSFAKRLFKKILTIMILIVLKLLCIVISLIAKMAGVRVDGGSKPQNPIYTVRNSAQEIESDRKSVFDRGIKCDDDIFDPIIVEDEKPLKTGLCEQSAQLESLFRRHEQF
jgi:hypothetical protein